MVMADDTDGDFLSGLAFAGETRRMFSSFPPCFCFHVRERIKYKGQEDLLLRSKQNGRDRCLTVTYLT